LTQKLQCNKFSANKFTIRDKLVLTHMIRLIAIMSLCAPFILSLGGCFPLAVIATEEVGTSIAEERTIGDIVDDKTIMLRIKSAFAQKDFGNLLSRLSVHVKERRVLLTGSVRDDQYSVEAVKITWSIQGVKEVISEIEVANKSLKTRAADSLIATHIRAKLLFQKGLNSLNYTVDVNNGIVYLLGIAQDEVELELALDTARKVLGVTKVVNHVILRDDARRQ